MMITDISAPQDFINHISNVYKVSKEDARKSVEMTFQSLSMFLSRDKSVKIKGFGTFSLYKRALKTYQLPQGPKMVPSKAYVKLKAEKTIKELVKAVGIDVD